MAAENRGFSSLFRTMVRMPIGTSFLAEEGLLALFRATACYRFFV